jgi:putative restriction endonuclease
MVADVDLPLRLAAFSALRVLTAIHGEVLPWAVVDEGFTFNRQPYRFANLSKGIFRPAGMKDAALSLKTTVPRQGEPKYDDLETDDAFVYAFQRRGPDYHDNRLLRRAIELRAPLIYFYGVAPGHYRPLWPAYASLISQTQVSLSIEPADQLLPPGEHVADPAMQVVIRRYATVEAKKRLHQDVFRLQILKAYETRCAVCNLPRRELLDAAHILPDQHERGAPIIPNGIALCKLHHSAYDNHLMGIRPDSVIEISQRLMAERDGPVLELGLKSFNGLPVRMPKKTNDRPNTDHLEERYQLFRQSALNDTTRVHL